jgi:hypothetical protein
MVLQALHLGPDGLRAVQPLREAKQDVVIIEVAGIPFTLLIELENPHHLLDGLVIVLSVLFEVLLWTPICVAGVRI